MNVLQHSLQYTQLEHMPCFLDAARGFRFNE
jgi:hypothetical protein